MTSTLNITKARAAALLAVCALGAGGGVLAGCGGDSENTSDDTVPAEVTTAADGGAVTVPGSTGGETVTAEDVQTVPAPSSTTGGTPSGSSTTTSTTKGSSTTSATVPGGSPSSAPENPGGSAAPDDGGGTATSGSGSGSSGSSGSGSSGGSNADQDPECKPGTGPGQPLPQCEPVSGEDAQDDEG